MRFLILLLLIPLPLFASLDLRPELQVEKDKKRVVHHYILTEAPGVTQQNLLPAMENLLTELKKRPAPEGFASIKLYWQRKSASAILMSVSKRAEDEDFWGRAVTINPYSFKRMKKDLPATELDTYVVVPITEQLQGEQRRIVE